MMAVVGRKHGKEGGQFQLKPVKHVVVCQKTAPTIKSAHLDAFIGDVLLLFVMHLLIGLSSPLIFEFVHAKGQHSWNLFHVV
jgi:hypothetical protein